MADNIGSQIITIKQYDTLLSPLVNKRQKDVVPVGVHAGGLLSVKDSRTATVSPVVCEIQSATGDHDQIRGETTANVDVSVSEADSFVVLRWTYTGVAAADYMEILAVSTPEDYDVVLGQCVFQQSDSSLQSFDYADSDYPRTNGRAAVAAAWIKWTVSGTTYTIASSHNIASLTRTNKGRFTIAFATPMLDSNYVILSSTQDLLSGQQSIIGSYSNLTVNGFNIAMHDSRHDDYVDCGGCIVVFGL